VTSCKGTKIAGLVFSKFAPNLLQPFNSYQQYTAGFLCPGAAIFFAQALFLKSVALKIVNGLSLGFWRFFNGFSQYITTNQRDLDGGWHEIG
jgi:hypothetical protein